MGFLEGNNFINNNENLNNNNFKDERVLFTLSRGSPLLDFLRAMYSLMLDYGVYMPDNDAEPLIFSKEQLVFLIERGHTDLLLRDLPELEKADVIRAIKLDEFEKPEKIQALIIERRGVSMGTLAGAFNPESAEYPAWWTAPIPFAMCGRRKVRLNPAALSEFGTELERMNVSELPEKDEFIVELEGHERPFFLSFRRLAAGIFALEDCTGDLVEAQDISWWAGLGRLWVRLLEAEGRKWRRLEELPEADGSATPDDVNIWPCEWQDRFMGYFCVENGNKKVEKVNKKGNKINKNINKNKVKNALNSEGTGIDSGSEDHENAEKDKNNIDNINDDKNNDKSDKKIGNNYIDAVDVENDKKVSETEQNQNNKNKNKEENEEEEKEEIEIKAEIKEEIQKDDKDDNIKEIKDEAEEQKKEHKENKKEEKEKKEEEKGKKKEEEKTGQSGLNDEKNDILRAISPQTLGLLAPGLANYYENIYDYNEERERAPVKRRLKGDLRL